MKNKLLFVILVFLFLSQSTLSQEDSVKLNQWVPKAVLGLNVSQIALSNWSKGGDNSITWTITANGGLGYQTIKWKFDNNLSLAYGRTKLGSQDFRTNDNDFYLESIISRSIDWAIDPYFSNTIRTAVATGYDYEVDPPQPIAAFWDPGYVTQSLGFLYDKPEGFSFRLGVAVQEVFTNKYTSFSDDPDTDEIEKFKLETGIESVTNTEVTIAENMLAKSILRLFTRFEEPDVWDVRWDNTISAKVNNFLNVNLTFLLIYEKQQSPKTQIKEALQLGFVYTIY